MVDSSDGGRIRSAVPWPVGFKQHWCDSEKVVPISLSPLWFRWWWRWWFGLGGGGGDLGVDLVGFWVASLGGSSGLGLGCSGLGLSH